MCPNAGKCDFGPDQKIGGEIINLDTASLEQNLAAADLGSQHQFNTAAITRVEQPTILSAQWVQQPANLALQQARMQEFAAIQNNLNLDTTCPCNKPKLMFNEIGRAHV